ncbi:hypothetical protein [Saccharothrix obliqua]|uniref:hypothetical protein n=1 Tax=Saccharothrix obliqua TaxID=2861747 RepID=UPI001C60607E|nr:hypothetical protein [Saccharothrix obliqua]MBW4719536.1 hypothetical protein [Saccharothrix obliqua]
MAGERAPKAVSLAVVVVLAAVCLASWAVWGKPVPAAAWHVPPTGEAGRIAGDPLVLALADPGGRPGFNPDVRHFGDVADLKFLHHNEIAAVEEEGAGAARFAQATDHPAGRVLVFVVRMADRDAARRAADRLDELQLAFGLERRGGVAGVERVVGTPAAADDTSARPTARAHYTHDDLLVRLQTDAGAPEALDRFADVVARQVKALPADG